MGIVAILVMWPGPFEDAFVHPMKLYEYQRSRSFIDLGPNLSDSIFLNFFSSITTGPIEAKFHVEPLWMYSLSWLHLPTLISDYNSFWKIHYFTFFLYKSTRDQIWPCRKIGQGQLGVIIWTNLVVQKPDAAYQLSRSSAIWFQRRRFFKVFTIYEHGGHDLDHLNKLSFFHPMEAPHEI